MPRAGRLLRRAATALAFACVLLARPASGHDDGTPLSVTGEFEVVIADDFEHGSQTFFFVRELASGRVFELHFDAPPGHLRTGQPVAVHGRARGRVLQVEGIAALGEGGSGGGGATAAAPQQRAAVLLLVDLRDARASDRYTLDQIAGHMWTGARSVDGLSQAASWDQLSFPPDTDADGFADAFGPYTIDQPAASCDPYGWAAAADAAASAGGVNLSLYRHRVYVLPRYDQLGCSWAGLGNVGCGSYCRSWIAEGESPMVYAHELGHNLGMGHAGTDPENDGVENVEYGDYSDPMGSSRQWHVFNGAHTDQLGWFGGYPGSLASVASDGVFDLFPMSLHPLATGGVRTLRIERPATGERYYLSYRQRLGYDDSLASTYAGGVSIHRFAGGSSHTHYIRTLADGGLFEDPGLGLSVVQLGRASDGSYATVQVSFGCAPLAPTLVVSPASQATVPGGSLAYTVSVTNRDGSGCDATGFPLVALFPSGLSGSLGAASLLLAPGASGSTSLSVTPAPGSDARYDFSVQASGAGGMGSDSATAVADGTPPTAPTLAGALKRKSQIELSWSGASDGSGSGIASYRLHREGGSGLLDMTVSGTPYLDRATTSGVTYTYTVFARDAVGHESASSNAVTLTAGGTGGGSGGGKGGRPR